MGRFVITIDAVGNHGCQREIKDGGTITAPCGQDSCVDCQARAFVEQLRARGASVNKAALAHWPSDGQVIDDLVSGARKGSF